MPGFECIVRDRIVDKTGYGGVAVYVRGGLILPFRVRHDIYRQWRQFRMFMGQLQLQLYQIKILITIDWPAE